MWVILWCLPQPHRVCPTAVPRAYSCLFLLVALHQLSPAPFRSETIQPTGLLVTSCGPRCLMKTNHGNYWGFYISVPIRLPNHLPTILESLPLVPRLVVNVCLPPHCHLFDYLLIHSDDSHLSPLTTDMNSPWLLSHHAQVVARARNLPATVVLERAALNTTRFYGLEDDWDVHGWLGLYYSLFGFAVMVGLIVLDTFTGLPVACLIDPLMHPSLGSLSWLGPYCGLHRIVICFIIAVPWLGWLLWWGPYCGLHWAVIFYRCPNLGSRVPVGLTFIGCFHCGWSTIVSHMGNRFAVTGWA